MVSRRDSTGAALVALVLTLFFLAGCRPVPIQTARVAQMDFYRQYYDFDHLQETNEVVEIITSLVGSRNYNLLLRKVKLRNTLKAYLRDSLEVRGALMFSIYLMPTDLDSFFIDGIGRYALIYKETNNILFSGDFYIKNNRFSVSDLDKDTLTVQITQSLVRHSHPDSISYFESDSIYFKIKMLTLSKEKGIYVIDYRPMVEHPVVYRSHTIGYLKFDDLPANRYKLIDLRGRGLIKRDYDKYLQQIESTFIKQAGG